MQASLEKPGLGGLLELQLLSVTVTCRQSQLSVSLSRTNYFVISWENPFQTVHSTSKHDIQTFSVLLWNTNKCESFGNLSFFCLSLAVITMEGWSLWGFQREAEMEWKCCATLLCPVRIMWGVHRLLIAVNSPLHTDIKENQTWEIFMSRAWCAFYAFSPKPARLLKARWRCEIHRCKSRAFHQPHSAEGAESGPPTQDPEMLVM